MRKNNAKINLPPLEEIQILTLYTFTINLQQKLNLTIQQRVRQYEYKINHFFKDYMYIEIYPELSSSGRLHYHGICSFTSLQNIWFFYENMHRQNGYTLEIDTIEDLPKWNTYCTKQNKYKFIYDNLNISYQIKAGKHH